MSIDNPNARRMTGIVTLLLVALMALGACGGGADPTPTPSAAATVEAAGAAPGEPVAGAAAPVAPVVEPAAVSDDAAVAAVANAFRTQMDNLPMRITAGDEGSDEYMMMEVESPTRLRMSLADMQLLLVDGQLHLQDGKDWVDGSMFASIAETIIANYAPVAVEESINKIVSAEQLPDEEVNGEPTSVYLVTTSFAGAVGSETTKVYIRKADGLLMRLEAMDENTDDQFVIDYEYDDSIVIEAP